MQALHSPQVWCTNAEGRSAELHLKHTILPEAALIGFAVALSRAAATNYTLNIRASKRALCALSSLSPMLTPSSAAEPRS